MNGTITKYVYDGSDVLLEFNSENALNARYVHGGKVDEPLKMERKKSPYRNESFPEQYFYYHKDRLGSITEITNSIGEVVQRYVYDSFGRVTIYDNQGNKITADSDKYLENPFTYTGREYDAETGLYYYRARYYDPETGRFISEDPIGLFGRDGNFYRYVFNNPVNYIDPEGEETQEAIEEIEERKTQLRNLIKAIDDALNYAHKKTSDQRKGTLEALRSRAKALLVDLTLEAADRLLPGAGELLDVANFRIILGIIRYKARQELNYLEID